MADHNNLVFFSYGFSPFGRKVLNYLTLRGIDYYHSEQPVVPPRDALLALGVNYRRIPVLAHGRDVYCDTRLILDYLDSAIPASDAHPGLAPSASDGAYANVLNKWVVEGGVFAGAAACLPPDLPALNDPKFVKDRESFSGISWSQEALRKNLPQGQVFMRDAFAIIEEQVLGDGRKWVLGGDSPSRADCDVVWPFQWLTAIPNALPEASISAKHFPKTFDWVKRFNAAVKAAKERGPKIPQLKPDEAAKQVLSGPQTSKNLTVDETDPTGFKAGQVVQSYPSDWGFAAKDKGKLVGLTRSELVMESESPKGGSVFIHYPRITFKATSVDTSRL